MSLAHCVSYRGGKRFCWAHPDTAPERGQKPSPLPPSHALGAHGRGVIPFSTLPRAAARPARSGTGLALGYYLAAPPGQNRAALRAGRVELVAVSGYARSACVSVFMKRLT